MNNPSGIQHASKRISFWVICAAVMVIALVTTMLRPYIAVASDADKGISIRLEEVSKPDAEVYIGQAIGRLFKVTNTENDCFIRLKTTLDDTDCVTVCSYTDPLEEDWTQAEDGWWYLSRVLSCGDVATFSSSMSIYGDASIGKNVARAVRFSEITTVEALDADVVCPDWGAMHPWGDFELSSPDVKDVVQLGDYKQEYPPISGQQNVQYLRSLAQTFDDLHPLWECLLIIVLVTSDLLIACILCRASMSRKRFFVHEKKNSHSGKDRCLEESI